MARKLFTNARVVTPAEVFLGTVEVHADRIVRVDLGATSLPAAEDFGGDYLVPGLVDLDAGALDLTAAAEGDLIATDLAAAAAGCTTVFSTLTLAADGATTTVAELTRISDRLADWRQRGTLRCDHFLRLVVPEDGTARAAGEVLLRLGTSLARLASLPGTWFAPGAAADLPRLAHWREAGAALGAHTPIPDSATTAARQAGVTFVEGPARMAGDTRGFACLVDTRDGGDASDGPGSASACSGLCLVSAGRPIDLLRGVFRHRDRSGWTLPESVACATAHPARLAGLADRGRVEVGLRADFVRVRREGALVVPIATWRAGQRFS